MSGHRRRRANMARPISPKRRHRTTPLLGVLAIAAITLAAGTILLTGGAGAPPGSAGQSAGASQAAVAGAPTGTPRPSPFGNPRGSAAPTTTALPSQTPRPAASARPSPARSIAVGRSPAPRNAHEFDLAAQVIDIAFPLRPGVEYRYRDNWLERRAGQADPYNHARMTDDGRLLRLHDGIDIYGPEGAPVVAPFAGRVIDPSARWQPWEPNRYGLTVVIESTERHSQGYVAMLIHLDQVWVVPGERVERGQEIGVLGRTGNATEVRPHLHFELRAPFEIDWTPLGEPRRVDAFNPFPSLVRADPKR